MACTERDIAMKSGTESEEEQHGERDAAMKSSMESSCGRDSGSSRCNKEQHVERDLRGAVVAAAAAVAGTAVACVAAVALAAATVVAAAAVKSSAESATLR